MRSYNSSNTQKQWLTEMHISNTAMQQQISDLTLQLELLQQTCDTQQHTLETLSTNYRTLSEQMITMQANVQHDELKHKKPCITSIAKTDEDVNIELQSCVVNEKDVLMSPIVESDAEDCENEQVAWYTFMTTKTEEE